MSSWKEIGQEKERKGSESIFRLVNDLAACTGYKETTWVVREIVLAEIPTGSRRI